MEHACVYAVGLFHGARLFLRSRLISMGHAYLYGAGLFLRNRSISMKQADFYEAGTNLHRARAFLHETNILSRSIPISLKIIRV